MSWGLWGLDKTAGADDFPHRYTGYPQVATVHMPTEVAHYYRFNDGIDGTERDDKRLQAGMPTLTDSIAAEGIQRPIEINTDGKYASIIDGHHRLGCARRLGLDVVPVTINWERDCSGPNQKPVEDHLRQILADNPGPYRIDDHHTASTDGIRYAHIIEADVAEDLRKLAMPPRPFLRQADQWPDRAAALENPSYDDFMQSVNARPRGPQSLHRGVGLLRDYLPPDLESRLAAASGGQPDPDLINDLLHHIDREGQGMGQYWSARPEDAASYSLSAALPGQDMAQPGYMIEKAPSDYHVRVSGDWDGSGGELAHPDQDDNVYKLNPGSGLTVRSVQVRRGGPRGSWGDWIDLGGAGHRTAQRTAMPAPLPQGTYFRYHPELVWSPGVTAHAPGGKQVGSLEWYDDDHIMVDLGTRRPGEIDRIQVPEDHRGQSIATSMFDFAKNHEPRLHHSDQLTDDGRGWSQYEQSRRNARLAAVTQDLVDRLKGEFHGWRKQQPRGSIFGGGIIGGLDEWTNIEKFLKDQYPAAHRGLGMGYEMAGPLLDGRPMQSDYMMSGPLEYSTPQPYATGPEAEAQHGYDPKEIAAGMLLLHNKSDRFRGDMSEEDQGRLNDIAQKRYQMQRNYEQRQTTARLAAVTRDLVDHLEDQFHDWWGQNGNPDEADHGGPGRGPIGHWPHVENFLRDTYPAAHKNLEMGMEEAGALLDGHPPQYMIDNGLEKAFRPPAATPYETGPEAVARHGYDPAEVAASMVLLHNDSHPHRGQDIAEQDTRRLVDIFKKRMRMQRDYEQRQPVTASFQLPYLRNNNGMRHIPGFDQNVEPWGRYMSPDDPAGHRLPVQHGWERGDVSFDNPRLIPHEYGAWKKTLSAEYGGLTGQALTRALAADGHDGVITHDKYGIGEIVDLRPKDQRRHRVHAGKNGPLPPLTFQHHPAGFDEFPDVIQPSQNVSNAWPTVSAHDGDRMIGHIQWDGDHPRHKGRIWDLRVHPDYQRRGVATALFDWATDQVEPELHHSHNLSDEGRAFADSEFKRPLAEERYKAWQKGQPMPKRFAGRNGPPPPMTFEPFNTMWTNGIMARHAEDGRPLAHLHWYPDGEIETIRVHPQMRGRDVGKAILTHAASHPETYQASDGIQPSNTLTPEGRAFARSMGHNPTDDEVTPAEGEDQWAWKAVDRHVPMHIPYTGQNEAEMSNYLDQPWTPPTKTASADDGWPVWWRGRHRPGVPFDKRWHPNHPEHTPAPWDN